VLSSTDVSFTDDNRIAYTLDNKGSTFAYRIDDIPSADFSATSTVYQKQNSLVFSYNENGPASLSDFYTISNTSESSRVHVGDKAIGGSKGLTVPDVDYNYTYGSQMAFITSSYNSGWQNRFTKLATLSDTDDTDVTGSELVTNGTFDTDTSGWSIDNGSVTLSVSSGALVITTTSASYGYAYQGITGLTVGETYTFSFNKLSSTAATWVRLGTSFDGQTYYGTTPSNGITNVTFTATSSTLYITLVIGAGSSGLTCSFDDISVRLAEEDRSVNGNGLQVFGTVTKTFVDEV